MGGFSSYWLWLQIFFFFLSWFWLLIGRGLLGEISRPRNIIFLFTNKVHRWNFSIFILMWSQTILELVVFNFIGEMLFWLANF